MGQLSGRVATARAPRGPTRAARGGLAILVILAAALGVMVAPQTVRPSLAATGPDCGPQIAKPGGGYWQCTFADPFKGRRLDRTKWHPLTSARSGLVKHECRVDDPDNIRVRFGTLRLTAREERAPVLCRAGDQTWWTRYTAGAVTTGGIFSQAYGRFEIRAKMPRGKVAGLHSAIWMWPQVLRYGDASGEIDIAEFRTALPDRVVPTAVYDEDGSPQETTNWDCVVKRPDRFHRYVLEWTPQTLTFIYDDEVCLVNNWRPAAPLTKPQPFNVPFYLILNQSISGPMSFDPETAPLPGTMFVDYVRVWK